jgi:hypothetical protein
VDTEFLIVIQNIISTISTPTPLDDLKKCREHPWKIKDDNCIH